MGACINYQLHYTLTGFSTKWSFENYEAKLGPLKSGIVYPKVATESIIKWDESGKRDKNMLFLIFS